MEFSIGNIFIRDNDSPHKVGWRMDGHTHNFDHATYIVRGKYRCIFKKRHISDDGAEGWVTVFDQVVEGPYWLLIEANAKHDFECIEGPGILHCVYAHRDPQTKEVVQKWNGWYGAVS